MKVLEVELGEELASRRRAIRNFQGRVVIVHHRDIEPIKGRIVDSSELMSYTLRVPGNRFLAFFHHSDKQLGYNTLEKMELVDPKKTDELSVRESYREITEATIATTVKAAQRYRT